MKTVLFRMKAPLSPHLGGDFTITVVAWFPHLPREAPPPPQLPTQTVHFTRQRAASRDQNADSN